MASSRLAIIIFMTRLGMMRASSDSCDKHLNLRGPEMAALINRTYPSCDQKDFSKELPICQIDKDNRLDTGYAPGDRLPASSACPDGTWNRTCYPRAPTDMFEIHMECVCHSGVPTTDNIRETHWGNWQKLDPPVNGAHYTRRLMMGTECIGQEFDKTFLQPIVKTHSLPDSVYTASSYYNSASGPYRARIDNYYDYQCAWVAASADVTNPWLAITLPTEYSVKGMMIKKRCDSVYTYMYPTMITVSTSHDDVTYQDVVVREDLSAGYDDDLTAYIMFTQVYTTRFWLIHVKAYSGHPAMKCDLLGFE